MENKNYFYTVIFQHQTTQVPKLFQTNFNIETGKINFGPLIVENFHKHEKYRFRIYNFLINQYELLVKQSEKDQYNYNIEFLNSGNNVILLKYCQQNSQTCSASNFSQSLHFHISSDTQVIKKQRSKERYIYEVIQIVRKWRNLHMYKGVKGRISLNEAAKLIGLPKKSLDDYYYQLRLGEKYNFDFRQHLNEKIGALRNFLKNIKSKDKPQKIQKHPKKLKIIDDIQQLRQQMKIEMQMIQQKEIQKQNDIENQSIQNQFYNDFQYFLNQPQDPFTNLDSKKINLNHSQSYQILF